MSPTKAANHKNSGGPGSQSLPAAEIILYTVGFCCPAAYSIYCVYVVSMENEIELLGGKQNVSAFLGRRMDATDFEWTFWKTWFKNGLFGCFLGHVIVSNMVKRFIPKYKKECILAYSFLSLYCVIGLKPLALLTLHSLLFYAAAVLRSKLLCWGMGTFLMATLNSSLFRVLQYKLAGSESTYYLVLSITAISILRQVSFSLDVCRRKDKKVCSVVDLLVYNFYIPLAFLGPVVTYDTFQEHFKNSTVVDKARAVRVCWYICRVTTWAVFTEMACHFLYFCALEQNGHFLHVKYVIFYGMTSALATLDGVETPPLPRCVSTCYSFRTTWKYFDSGLNIFLVRYVYIPLGGSRKGLMWQLLGSAACFSFVCFWHGGHDNIAMWSVFNWAGIVVESLGAALIKTSTAQTYLNTYSLRNLRRMKAAMFAPVATLLIINNLVFVGGRQAGSVYFHKLLTYNFPVGTLGLLFTMYCSVQLIFELERVFYKKSKMD
ncbi:LOW QUALITY PROTEIN: protein-cysteine N-palmitoyltransferase HHAT-like [Branchiostoma floridae]|uniref:LOW QUALITY PROTEIN: protein-cysteine N-palmitoyltransferase HHAT-like n=1 Tax=Branchiostoma floridae TaxID=7739 RepID=A0A9J7LYE3_BRAFL|nr:LOW QUALITY PROTEIN: protein-cysteine N-palmitoyltransferase HHAT-like [Branchiostoma floridae]